jgi:xylogalacturonan beta-1,3-xylosyltransferase
MEFQEILARSRFSLCPRGVGTATLRFWESLAAGAIPVLISDHFELPGGTNWPSCVLRIPEEDAPRIDAAIRAVDLETERSMRHAAIEAYGHYSGNNIIGGVRQFYNC